MLSDFGTAKQREISGRALRKPDNISGLVYQDFGVAVSLEADEPRLYNLVRQRLQLRLQQRGRIRP